MASGLVAFQIRSTGVPLLTTGSDDLMKVKRCCRGRRQETGDGCSPLSSSMSSLKENVLSAPLSLVNSNFAFRTQLRISIPSEKFLPINSFSLPGFPSLSKEVWRKQFSD